MTDDLLRAWPLYALRIRVAGCELRLPTEPELAQLAVRATGRVLDAEHKHFMGAWTQLAPGEFERNLMAHHYQQRAAWTPQSWNLLLAAFPDRDPAHAAGIMGLSARSFAITRAVSTGSWLLPDYRGVGLGTKMRYGVLHLAFCELAAQIAVTTVAPDNLASVGVCRRLGYRTDGTDRVDHGHGHAQDVTRFRLDSEDFTRRPDCEVRGVNRDLRSLFGAA